MGPGRPEPFDCRASAARHNRHELFSLEDQALRASANFARPERRAAGPESKGSGREQSMGARPGGIA
jgi:hypothetical protein